MNDILLTPLLSKQADSLFQCNSRGCYGVAIFSTLEKEIQETEKLHI